MRFDHGISLSPQFASRMRRRCSSLRCWRFTSAPRHRAAAACRCVRCPVHRRARFISGGPSGSTVRRHGEDLFVSSAPSRRAVENVAETPHRTHLTTSTDGTGRPRDLFSLIESVFGLNVFNRPFSTRLRFRRAHAPQPARRLRSRTIFSVVEHSTRRTPSAGSSHTNRSPLGRARSPDVSPRPYLPRPAWLRRPDRQHLRQHCDGGTTCSRVLGNAVLRAGRGHSCRICSLVHGEFGYLRWLWSASSSSCAEAQPVALEPRSPSQQASVRPRPHAHRAQHPFVDIVTPRTLAAARCVEVRDACER